jgi:hypothetical protein
VVQLERCSSILHGSEWERDRIEERNWLRRTIERMEAARRQAE